MVPLQEESKWLESGSDDADMDESEECNDDPIVKDDNIIESASPIQEPEGIDEGYIFVFLTKYVCECEECEGTLAPTPSRQDIFECNRCSRQSTEADFSRRLAAAHEETED